ncbi:MAG TPA: hypothetical protein ENK88_04470 [Campylobacterales bacterium]|nr:hypothetical protein [Campylobacterales bacterium]HHC11201.1 hypothetical protein [Campylobacterales bacterium]
MLKKLLLIMPIFITLSYGELIKPVIQLSFEGGGDELVTIDHDYENDYTIDAGDGLSLEMGMSIDNPVANFETQLLIGYKFDSDSASNGDMTWSIIPISALGFIKVPYWRFGGGFTYHLSPELRSTFDNDRFTDEFNNALGGIVQIQYEPTDFFAVGLKGTFIEYELKSDPSKTASGNSLGLVLTIKFGGTRSRYR